MTYFPFYFQVNFFDDHTKLILNNIKNEYMATYVDQERCARTYNLSHIIKEGCTADILDRMAFARLMLKNLVDIEGADIWGVFACSLDVQVFKKKNIRIYRVS